MAWPGAIGEITGPRFLRDVLASGPSRAGRGRASAAILQKVASCQQVVHILLWSRSNRKNDLFGSKAGLLKRRTTEASGPVESLVLAKVIGVHVKNHMDIIRQAGGIENGLDVTRKEAGIAGLEEELEAEEAVSPGGWCRVWDSQFDVGGKISGEPLMQVLKGEFGQTFVLPLAGEESGMGKGWEFELAPEFEFLVRKALVVMVPSELDGRRVWSKGLNDDFSLHFPAPGASGDLGEKLEGSLPGTKVRSV